MTRGLYIILAAVALDAIAIGLIFPILPSLIRELTSLSEIDILLGITISVFGAAQFLFSPILGVLSDRFGRRPVLIISMAGATIDYIIMVMTPFFWLIIVTRIVAGITSANMAVATAYITDVSTPEERPGRFGLLHAMFGLGFIIGPVIGGILGEWWVRAPFAAAALLNFANLAFALFLLPESLKERTQKRFEWSEINPLKPLAWAFSLRALVPFLIIFAALGFVGQVYGSLWVLYGEEQWNWSPFMIGMSLAAFGAVHALVQATLPGPITKWFGQKRAALVGFSFEIFSLFTISFLFETWAVLALIPFFALGGVGTPALQTIATETVDENHQGQLQGVLMSLASLATIFAPVTLTAIYAGTKASWPGFVWVFVGSIYVAAFIMLVFTRVQNQAQNPVPETATPSESN